MHYDAQCREMDEYLIKVVETHRTRQDGNGYPQYIEWNKALGRSKL
jgi:phage protein U